MSEISSSPSLSPEQQHRLHELLALPHVLDILDLLNKDAAITKVVGGAVRNALLGCEIKDVDFATTLLPQAVMECAIKAGVKAVPTGFDHGTVTLVFEGTAFEVTTLREDVATDGRHAVVQFGTSFAHDAQRRDFTINALYVDHHGQLDDFLKGLEDLLVNRVRFIGDPVQRIREDGLRIIRFFRFSAWYGLGVCDSEGLQSTLQARSSFICVSRERIRSEFFRLLDAPYAEPVLEEMADCGWLQIILGGIGYRARFARVCSQEPILFRERLWRLAAISVLGPWDVDRLKDVLCLTRVECGELSALSRWCVQIRTVSKPVTAPLLCAWMVKLIRFDILAVALALEESEMTDEAHILLTEWREGATLLPDFPFSGSDLLELGLAPGSHIGLLLEELKDAWSYEWYKAWAHDSFESLEAQKTCVLKRILKL